MIVLRTLFLVAVALVVALVLTHARWESQLQINYNCWILPLPQAPLWLPPAVPTYQQFRKIFHDIPEESTPGLTITRRLKSDWMLLDFLLYLWGLTFAFGIVYRVMRGERHDSILHGALYVGVALTASAGVCVGLWFFLGGWGPPAPEFFGILGIVVGLWAAIWSYRRMRAIPS